MDTESLIAKSEGYFVEEIDGEWLLFRPESQKAIYLDEVASVIWQLCDGSRSASRIAEEIAVHYSGQEEEIRRDVKSTVDSLVEQEALILTARG